MQKLLTIGLSIRHKARLHGQLKDVEFRSTNDQQEALVIMGNERVDLLVVDEAVTDATIFLAHIKEMGIPTIFCAESQKSTGFLKSLVVELGVTVVLIKPIDPDELVRKTSELIKVAQTKEQELDSAHNEMAHRLLLMWAKFAPANRERVSWLRQQIVTLYKGSDLDDAVRREMEREAHKLVGALGTFGFPRASVLAREIENHISPSKGTQILEATQLLEWVQSIAREIENDPILPIKASQGDETKLSALLISEDQDLIELLKKIEIQGEPLKIEVVSAWTKARRSWFLHAPDLVVIDLCGELQEERQALLRVLGGRLATIPVLTLLPREIWSKPEALAKFAGVPVLFHPFEPQLLQSSIVKLLSQSERVKPRLLAVDDDPQILAAIESVLKPLKLEIFTLSDPLEFWDTLEATAPNLLVLDLDMPFLSGLELCRGVRSSTRWCDLPILILSASSDNDTINRLFSVGADDFVKKPFSGPEIATRIVNRLVRSTSAPQDKEQLTRVEGGLENLRAVLAEEKARGREVALALLHIKNDRELRERYGPAAMSVLNRNFGIQLTERIGELGLITRWRPGEYIIALPSQTLGGAKQQLELLLESSELKQVKINATDTESLELAAGITLVHTENHSLETALKSCQHNLSEAEKSSSLIVAQEHQARGKAQGIVKYELLILEPAEKTGAAVEKLMSDRGFHCHWNPDTEAAITALTSDPPSLETEVIFISSGGLGLLKKLGPITRLVNVVVAVVNEDELISAFNAGAFDCIEKPCKVATLIKRLERALEF